MLFIWHIPNSVKREKYKMLIDTGFLIATFTVPEPIGTSPLLLLWLLPIVMSVALIYKAAKLEKIPVAGFIKETLSLFGSIIGFIVLSAAALYLIEWLILE